ncbi:MAG TPA: ATP-binding protein [Anaerolineae bacterium]|nr:ATP-binding protein [Anaerolineae bacterium]
MSAHPATILVVDDDKKISDFIIDVLSEGGHQARPAYGGQEALDRLATRERDEIDLVLLDVMMPDIDGFTVARRLRANPATEYLPIIMVTSRDRSSDAAQGLELGADDYITKPFDPRELLARITAMLRLRRAEQNLIGRNRALAALNTVAQTIGRAVELPDVLRSALDQVLASLDLIGGMITLKASTGKQTPAVQRWPAFDMQPNSKISDRVAENGHSEKFYLRARQANQLQAACVPLRSRNDVLGTLVVAGSNVHADDALDLLMTIGSQIGAAVERARLYEEAQHRSEDLAVLNEITRAVTSSLDLDQVLKTSLHGIRQILHVQAGSLILVEPESGEWQFRNTLNTLEAYLRADALQPHTGIVHRVIDSREPLILNEVPLESKLHGGGSLDASRSTTLVLRNILAVPMIVKSRAVGAIVVINKLEGAFTSDDLEMLQFLAAGVAIAAENARLYGELADFAKELERSQAQLVQAEKLAATGRLAASIAHEINNPLQAIHNCLHLAINRPLTEAKKQHYLVMAQEEVERLITLVQRTLEFYRPSKGRSALTRVNDLIENVLALANKQLEQVSINVHKNLANDLPEISAVPDQLVQVWLNLIINAIEAMPDGGELTITTSATDEWLQVAIRDTGSGVDPEDAAKIFEPFYTTKATGTGLGLSVSYGIIQRHGGRIDVNGVPGEGTAFTVSLPIGVIDDL